MSPSPPEKPPLFESPDLHLDENDLLAAMSKEIGADNFQTLIYANYLMALCAHDHRCQRPVFAEILVTAFNYQNRLVRYSEKAMILDALEKGEGFGTTVIKADRDRHLAQAKDMQDKLIQTLQLLKEMRTPEDPVS
jgi:hypothetical protein